MSDRAAGSEATTAVTIFGRVYHLRGEGEPEYLERLAALVDGAMCEVAEGTGTADTLKVAILAALNIADANLRSGAAVAGEEPRHERRLDRLVARLDEALAETDAIAC